MYGLSNRCSTYKFYCSSVAIRRENVLHYVSLPEKKPMVITVWVKHLLWLQNQIDVTSRAPLREIRRNLLKPNINLHEELLRWKINIPFKYFPANITLVCAWNLMCQAGCNLLTLKFLIEGLPIL